MHRTRDLLVRQRSMLVNALRGHMAAFGIVARQGVGGVTELLAGLRGEGAGGLSSLAQQALLGLAGEIEAAILAWHQGNEASRRLAGLIARRPRMVAAVAQANKAARIV